MRLTAWQRRQDLNGNASSFSSPELNRPHWFQEAPSLWQPWGIHHPGGSRQNDLGFDREHARHGYPRSQVSPIPSPHSLAYRLSTNTCVRQYHHKAKSLPHAVSYCPKAFGDSWNYVASRPHTTRRAVGSLMSNWVTIQSRPRIHLEACYKEMHGTGKNRTG